MKWLRTFFREERGATAVEYCLLAMLIAIGLIVALQQIGSVTADTFNQIASNL